MDCSRALPADVLARVRGFEDLEAKITELWGHLNAATYRFLMLIAEFDRREGYGRHGLASTAQWLNWQCGIGPEAAREKVRTARALEALPEISASFAQGEISYSKVRAMTRVATAANECVLLNVARHGTAAHVEKLVQKFRWTQRRDAARRAVDQHEQRTAGYFFDVDGEFVLHARLPAEIGAVVRKAIEVATSAVREQATIPGTRNVSAETPAQIPANVWAADALRLMAERFLEHWGDEVGAGSSADRVQVVVHVDEAILSESALTPEAIAAKGAEPHRCELEDGPALAVDTVRRLCCDATVIGLVEGQDGEPLSVGRKTRSIPTAIARALKARDSGCRYPGCERRRFTHGHHVRHWADGGETKLSNLVMLCSFHHRLVHEGGYGVAATDDGLFVFTRPDGRRVEPNGAQRFRGNVATAAADETVGLRRLNREAGLRITAHTSRCGWFGESMDYSLAVEGMQSRDRLAATNA